MKIVAFIEGGSLQQVLADTRDCEVLLVDWDVQGQEGSDWLRHLTDTDGNEQGDGLVDKMEVEHDPEGVEHYFKQAFPQERR